jgi:hypothetical protein
MPPRIEDHQAPSGVMKVMMDLQHTAGTAWRSASAGSPEAIDRRSRLTVKPGQGHFAQVQVNESLTLDFADAPEPWGGPGFDPRTGRSHHYAFHARDGELTGRGRMPGVHGGAEPVAPERRRGATGMARAPVGTRRVCWHVCGIRMKRDHWGRSSRGGRTPLTQCGH